LEPKLRIQSQLRISYGGVLKTDPDAESGLRFRFKFLFWIGFRFWYLPVLRFSVM